MKIQNINTCHRYIYVWKSSIPMRTSLSQNDTERWQLHSWNNVHKYECIMKRVKECMCARVCVCVWREEGLPIRAQKDFTNALHDYYALLCLFSNSLVRTVHFGYFLLWPNGYQYVFCMPWCVVHAHPTWHARKIIIINVMQWLCNHCNRCKCHIMYYIMFEHT